MTEDKLLDVIIVGGSYAGLAAAMTLGRSLRNVLIIDSDKPCNRQTPHAHNFITQDGEEPQRIAEIARKQVLTRYSNTRLPVAGSLLPKIPSRPRRWAVWHVC